MITGIAHLHKDQLGNTPRMPIFCCVEGNLIASSYLQIVSYLDTFEGVFSRRRSTTSRRFPTSQETKRITMLFYVMLE